MFSPTMNQTLSPLFADVIFPDRIHRPFTYKIPETLSGRLRIGQWVVAPLGSRMVAGFILSLSGQAPPPWESRSSGRVELREIQELLTTSSDFELDARLVDLARWISDYYIAPLAVCLQLIQPPRLPGKITSRIRITGEGNAAAPTQRASTQTAKLLSYLSQQPKGATRSTLRHLVKTLDPVVARLKRQGFIEEIYSIRPLKSTTSLGKSRPTAQQKRTSSGIPLKVKPGQLFHSSPADHPGLQDNLPELPPWWEMFTRGLNQDRYQEFFLASPWARDLKVVERSVADTLTRGKSALIISPDISRATTIAGVLQEQWGDQVTLFHSELPESIKQIRWIAMSRGEVKIVVGTRLALFVPLPCLGLINLEDEHDPSFKDEQCPYYHSRDVARQRAILNRATILFQSRHPSLETYNHFLPSVRASGIRPDPGHSSPATMQVVDLRETPYGTILSPTMVEAFETSLQDGGGIVIYLNRKGFSSCLLCRDCGAGLECPRCQVSLNMFGPPARLVCTYCAYEGPVPLACPTCSSPRLEPAGLGTERVEEEIKKTFPNATIARLDRNAIRTREADTAVRQRFSEGKIKILIGTQMLFHGTPLQCVRLLGIPYAESGLHIPDFRAAEHLYRHLQQAVDLVSVEEGKGKVILQTRLPTHHAIESVIKQKPTLFYDHELRMRQAIGYPPATQLIQLSVSGTQRDRAQHLASQWAERLAMRIAAIPTVEGSSAETQPMILGPIPRRAHHPGTRHQFQVLLKAPPSDFLRNLVKDTLDSLKSDKETIGLQCGVNVDPVDML